MTEFVTPHLRTVLKTYQNSATKSLQGPGHSLAVANHHHNHHHGGGGNSTLNSIVKKELLSSPEPLDANESPTLIVQPPPPPEISQPILSAPDSGRGDLYETVLEGKTIGCFYLGGEMRLCLPQFLNNVLTDFTLDQINRIFDELRIFCSQCTPEQLMVFKAAKILPDDVKASGLITRTDAERLCSALLHRGCDRNGSLLDDMPKGAISFKVYHRCFGKCDGICTPDLYTYMKPMCIMCLECKEMFSPQKFVGHAHRKQENRTCHWGFDSRNWHDYLHVALDVENREKYTKMLTDLRDLEQQEMQNAQRDISYLKRKAEQMVPSSHCKREPIDIPPKKAKMHDLLDLHRYQQALYFAHIAHQEHQMSAFRPWAPKPMLPLPYSTVPAAALPYLSQEPPVLQNPERVVRHTESERFERTYQPNVALAPRKSILSKEREKERSEQRQQQPRSSSTHLTAITNIIEPEIIIKQERPNSADMLSAESTDDHHGCMSPISNKTNNSTSQHMRRLSLHSNYSQSHQQQQQQDELSVSPVSKQSQPSPPPQLAISPDRISSSNEITSSTSPILSKTFNLNSKSPSPAIVEPPQPLPSPHSMEKALKLPSTDGSSSRIRISKNLLSHSNVMRSPTPTPPPPAPQPPPPEQQFQLQSPSQSSSSTPRPQSGGVIITNSNNNGYDPLSNDEEDDDDDDNADCEDDDSSSSLNGGEADSSNMLSPWDLTADALKDVPPNTRDKVLQVIQRLIQEITQFRHCRLENLKLLQELHQRDEQIANMQLDLQTMKSQLSLGSNGSVIAKVESSQQSQHGVGETTTTSSAYQSKIKVPLKKSMRRSPEETVVVVNSSDVLPDPKINSTNCDTTPNSNNKQLPPPAVASLSVEELSDDPKRAKSSPTCPVVCIKTEQ